MENTRAIEIFENVKEILINNDLRLFCGICGVVADLLDNDKINRKEYKASINLLNRNKPKPNNQFKEFIENEFWSNTTLPIEDDFWWLPIHRCSETRQIRVDYLTKLIETLK